MKRNTTALLEELRKELNRQNLDWQRIKSALVNSEAGFVSVDVRALEEFDASCTPNACVPCRPVGALRA